MEELLKMAMSQGIWCLASVLLVIYAFKTNQSREEKYQNTIENNQNVISNLTKNIDVVTEIKTDVEEIKEKLNVSK